ncbi:MAG: hypothetical protein AB7O43_17515 [Hyphomicrobiaceae bacterium]
MLAQVRLGRLPLALLIASTLVLAGAGSPKPKHGASSASLPKADPLPKRIGRSPVTAIRPLSELQERIADGDHDAVRRQIDVAASVGRQLNEFAPDVWKDGRNRLALVKYVLSGGDPALLRTLVGQGIFDKSELSLARGTVAYATGRRGRAMGLLTEVDPRSLDWSLGGHVALIKAVLAGESDGHAGLAYCDEARLLSPGTLVEETSLRLSIDFAAKAGDWTLFQRNVLRYLYRFPKSPYAAVVMPRIARVVAANGDNRDEWRKLFSSIGSLMPEDRRGLFYAEVADLSLRSGRLWAAAFTAQMAGNAGTGTSAATTAQRAIAGTSMIFGDTRKQGLQILGEAVARSPSPEIAQLIAAARSLSAEITAPPDNSLLSASGSHAVPEKPASAKGNGSGSTGKPAPRQPDQYESLATKVRTRMTAADELIERAGS